MPKTNKKNGSQYWTLNNLVDKFYTSKFNRDNMHDPAPGEDINDSRLYRIYNKSDVKDLIHLLADYFEWAIGEENVSKLYITDNITLERETRLPTVRRANIVDELRSPERVKTGEIKAGKLYVTRGKYAWVMNLTGGTFQKMRELQYKDPEFIEKYEELQKSVDERNKNDDRK